MISRNREGHFAASFTLNSGFLLVQGHENFRKWPEPAIRRLWTTPGTSQRELSSGKLPRPILKAEIFGHIFMILLRSVAATLPWPLDGRLAT